MWLSQQCYLFFPEEYTTQSWGLLWRTAVYPLLPNGSVTLTALTVYDWKTLYRSMAVFVRFWGKHTAKQFNLQILFDEMHDFFDKLHYLE